MNRYAVENLFGIEGFHIAWYGVIIGIGMLLGIALALYRCRHTGICKDDIYDFALWLIPISIVCARAYYVIFEWDSYKNDLIEIFAIRNGGLAIYGGVIGGALTAVVFCHVKKIRFGKFVDTLIPSLVLGQAVGRWGNFVNEEAFGNLITNPQLQFFPYGVYINRLQEWHQATFFYESILNVVLLSVMLLVYPKLKKDGYLLAIYMTGYGTIRFLTEGLRTDSLYLVPGIRVSQVLSVVLAVAGILTAIWIYKRGNIKYEQTR